MADPYFVCELALEMHMPVGELGDRMSNHELCVVWPAFFDARSHLNEIEQARQERELTMQRRRL